MQWLLHLLADDEPAVVMLATKILARLLVVSGDSYVQKFVEKSGGMVVLQHRLKYWWNTPTSWPLCFAILFGIDVSKIDLNRPFDLFNLLDMFASGDDLTVVCPAVLPVITTMLEIGLRVVTRNQSDPDSPLTKSNLSKANAPKNPSLDGPLLEQRSMNVIAQPAAMGQSFYYPHETRKY